LVIISAVDYHHSMTKK